VDTIESITTFIDETPFVGLFGDLEALVSAISTTALTAIRTVVTGNVDLFYPSATGNGCGLA
jgi:hypothetical protein